MKKVGIKLVSSILLFSMIAYYVTPVMAYTKEESVYSKLNSNGAVYQTIVSNHLKNSEKSDILKDMSDLMDIENVSGNQEFTEENGKLIWKANGEDIYYQGNSKKELPIECKITYKLDGKEISKEEIAGKSGIVKINIEFTNKEKRQEIINGEIQTLYVPFLVGMGTIIDNENNKNIEITNGKVIDNGNKSFAFGLATPGMQESLGIGKDVIEIPSSIEISMEAKKFEMNEIYCYATPKLIDEDDMKLFDKIDKIYDMANELKDGSSKLVQGAEQLAEGSGKLNNGTHELSKELNAKILQYENARKKLANKEELEEKIVKIINDELKKLMPELKTLAEEEAKNVVKENLKGENGLEEKTAKTALNYSKIALNTKLNELENGNTEIIIPDELLNQIQNDVKTALKNVQNKQDVQALEGKIKELVIADITNTVKAKTNTVITENVEAMKKSVTDPTALLTQNEKEKLSQSENQIAKAMVPGIKAEAQAKGITLTDEQALAKALSSVNGLVTNVSKSTMDKTLDQVKQTAPTMAENTVKEVATKLSTNEAISKAISDYGNKIIAELKTSVGEETLNAIQKNIKKEITQELKNSLKNDKTLQEQISSKVKTEINPTIDAVAEKTATKLATDFTEDLANQIASNLIRKQLSGELSKTQLDKELSKYENLINSKLGEVDGQIDVLKDALNQLTAGTESLENGANELKNGMIKFDEQGIQKIYRLVNNNVKDLQTRVEKLKELSNEYNTFTNIDENAKGNVKFVMMIDSLKEKEEQKEQAVVAEGTKED